MTFSRRTLGAAALLWPLASFAAPEEQSVLRAKVAVLQWDTLDDLLTAGIVPAGAADLRSWSRWVRLPPLPEGIVSLGTRAEPDLDKIAALAPELIVAGASQQPLAEALSRIAPVRLFENHRAAGGHSQAETAFLQTLELAGLFSRRPRAEAAVAAVRSETAALGALVREAFGFAPRVQVIRFSSASSVFLYTPCSVTDWAVRTMGLSQPIVLPDADYGLTQVRLRTLKDLKDAYVVWIRPFAEEKKVLRSVLWQALPFVRTGHAAPGESYWAHGGTASAAAAARSIARALLSLCPNRGRSKAALAEADRLAVPLNRLIGVPA